MKKTLIALLCIILCVSILASCGSENPEKKPSKEEKEDTSYIWPSNINYKDYEGYEYRILEWGKTGGSHWSMYEFIYDEDVDGDVVNEAVKERDSKIEEKFNIKISYNVQDRDTIDNYCETSINSGSSDFDLVSLSFASMAKLSQKGLFLDLNDYDDYLNFDESWWNKSANDQIAVKGHLFFTVNNLTLTDKDATWVVYFTKDMLAKYPDFTKDYGGSLYTMVEEGEWTIDKMYEMVKAVSADVDGDGKMTDMDSFGHIGQNYNLCALMAGCGMRAIENDKDGIPTYNVLGKADKLLESYDIAYEIVTNENYSMLSSKMQNYGGYKDYWVDGYGGMMGDNRALFNITGMNRCRLFREMEFDFGIVPMPKANKSQEGYYTIIDVNCGNGIAVPATCEDEERTFSIFEALTCLASQTTYSAYIDKAITYKFLRDEESAKMLNIIYNNRAFDTADVYGWGSGCLSFSSLPSPTSFTSSLKASEKITANSIKKGLEKIDEAYETVKRN